MVEHSAVLVSTGSVYIVTCRPTSRQCPKYAHATIGKVLQELFSMWSAPCLLLGNWSLNTFPQKQTRGTVGDLLLGNRSLNTFPARKSVARQRRGKQALSRIQAMFSVGSVQSVYKRVEFRSWQFRSRRIES
jgi:hypothetical protein